MARKLYGFISIMSALTLILGLWLWLGYGFSGAWLHAKLLFVILLMGYHMNCGRYVRQMQRGKLLRSSKYYRLYNELPLLMFVPILILVVLKPF
jgi:putative membrane protein